MNSRMALSALVCVSLSACATNQSATVWYIYTSDPVEIQLPTSGETEVFAINGWASTQRDRLVLVANKKTILELQLSISSVPGEGFGDEGSVTYKGDDLRLRCRAIRIPGRGFYTQTCLLTINGSENAELVGNSYRLLEPEERIPLRS